MPRGRGRGGGWQSNLARANFFPLLTKPNKAVGKYCHVPGSYWEGCANADKKKIYKCIVVEFEALHDFGEYGKAPAFKLKEMGETGEGSLEPGVASGEDFSMRYPTPFLEYFYQANPQELPIDMQQPKAVTAEADETV
ncbi:hypothetical protein AB1Y20_020206 [Prymnesium parvum]|uniref:Uncharacterized protein n=1 Tax=Prymnesium parvum TaxID=97485 RepID=A0AB34JX99_PRYPA